MPITEKEIQLLCAVTECTHTDSAILSQATSQKSEDMIIASIYGKAGRDAELRQSANGKPWCKIGVACNAGGDRAKDEPFTQWIDVVAFGPVAEELARALKGKPVSAMGRLELNKWTTKEGEQRESLQLIAGSVIVESSAKPKGGGKQENKPEQPQHPFDDDIPF